MATVSKIHALIREGSNIYKTQWNGLSTADQDGDPLELPAAADQSVQVFGTFNGATVTIRGSNQDTPVVWATLHDAAGDLLSFTGAGIAVIAENVRHMRPEIVNGDGSTDVDVAVISRST